MNFCDPSFFGGSGGGKSTPQDKAEGKHFDAGYLIQYNRYIRHQGGVNGQAAVYKK